VTCYTVAYFNGARAAATAAVDGEPFAATFLVETDGIRHLLNDFFDMGAFVVVFEDRFVQHICGRGQRIFVGRVVALALLVCLPECGCDGCGFLGVTALACTDSGHGWYGGGEEGDQVQSLGEKVDRMVLLHGFLVILVEASRPIGSLYCLSWE
jgi:hypothetical protein